MLPSLTQGRDEWVPKHKLTNGQPSIPRSDVKAEEAWRGDWEKLDDQI